MSVTFYHRRKDGQGNALSLNLTKYNLSENTEGALWMSVAKQSGDRFDWEGRTNLKLGFNDLIQLVPNLSRRAKQVKLFHSFDENQTSIIFNRHVKDKSYRGYYLNINQETVFHFSPEEGYVFGVFLKDGMRKIVRWDLDELYEGNGNNVQSGGSVGTAGIEEKGDGDDIKDELQEDEFDEEGAGVDW